MWIVFLQVARAKLACLLRHRPSWPLIRILIFWKPWWRWKDGVAFDCDVWLQPNLLPEVGVSPKLWSGNWHSDRRGQAGRIWIQALGGDISAQLSCDRPEHGFCDQLKNNVQFEALQDLNRWIFLCQNGNAASERIPDIVDRKADKQPNQSESTGWKHEEIIVPNLRKQRTHKNMSGQSVTYRWTCPANAN